MVSRSSLVPVIAQFISGMPVQERLMAALLDTRIGSLLLHSHRMGSASSLALMILPFVYGIWTREQWRVTHLRDTVHGSILLRSHQMGSTSSRVQWTALFVCGMPRRDKWRAAH